MPLRSQQSKVKNEGGDLSTTVTLSSSGWAEYSVTISPALDSTANYFLFVQIPRTQVLRPDRTVEGILHWYYYLDSTSSWKLGAHRNTSNDSVELKYRLYRVPSGVVQHGKAVKTVSGTSGFTWDISLSAVDTNEALWDLNLFGEWGVHEQSGSHDFSVCYSEFTSSTNRRLHCAKSGGGTYHVGYQCWDPTA